MARELNLWAGIQRLTRCLIECAGLGVATVALPVSAAQIDIPGPLGSGGFGTTVTVLPNGNIVVTDPVWNAGTGAVYLYSPTGVLISTLTGLLANDQVGSGGVTVLRNGNYVVRSSNWDNGATVNAGAVTWANGSTGLSGVVSPANSLVGTTAGDLVGSSGVTALSNGNYVVRSPFWNNGAVADVGAATWADGNTGLSGVVSPANSLIGSSTSDQVGISGVTALSNGNYVVRSILWDNGGALNVGAVTWANGSTGLSGMVSPANSLIGTTAVDVVGSGGVTALSNGNYVVASPFWANGATTAVGAVTWANGGSGLSGVVSQANSLIGSSTNDSVGIPGVTALSNGNYVVASSSWDYGATADVGAVTRANGSTGLSGIVSVFNSLFGTTSSDQVGNPGVTALSNGSYVVASRFWNNGAVADVGAATWADGSTGLSGVVSPANSLIGTTTSDQVGSRGVTALSNGNYVVASPDWNGFAADAGAVTWANGSTGLSGIVSVFNSLFGTTSSDQVGFSGVTALSNGNYVVASSNWDNGATANAGAVTWANGSTELSSAVQPANSLIGTTSSDLVGNGGVTALSNGDYVVRSEFWANGAIADAGAVTLALGDIGLIGKILAANSVRGTVAGGGTSMVFGYDAAREQLVVGRPASNIVSLFRLSSDLIFSNGFE